MTRTLRGRPQLAFLFVTVFVDMVGYGILATLLPFYARELDGGAVAVGLLGALYAAMQLVGGPILGPLLSGLLFEGLGAPFPYLLATLALLTSPLSMRARATGRNRATWPQDASLAATENRR